MPLRPSGGAARSGGWWRDGSSKMDDWEELDERSLHLPGSKSESSAGKTLGEQMIEQREKEEFQGEDEDNNDEQQDLEAAPRPEPTPAEAQKQRGTRAQVAAQRKEKQEKAQQRKPDEQNTPLEDATAEKLRQQRLQEESDLQLAQDAFAGAGSVNLDTFVPKTEAEHEQLADLLHKRYLHSLKHSGHYPSLLQKLLRDACDEMTSTEVKEIENVRRSCSDRP